MQGANLAGACSSVVVIQCVLPYSERYLPSLFRVRVGLLRNQPPARIKKRKRRQSQEKEKLRAKQVLLSSVRSNRATTRTVRQHQLCGTEMPPGRPPKRPGEADIGVLDGSDAASSSTTTTTTAKCKLPRIDRADRPGRADFSSVVKSKLQSYTRTGQACDRCKVCVVIVFLCCVCISMLYTEVYFLYIYIYVFICAPMYIARVLTSLCALRSLARCARVDGGVNIGVGVCTEFLGLRCVCAETHALIHRSRSPTPRLAIN